MLTSTPVSTVSGHVLKPLFCRRCVRLACCLRRLSFTSFFIAPNSFAQVSSFHGISEVTVLQCLSSYLPNSGITISPSTLLKSDLNSNLTVDLSLTAELRGKIFAGLGYRNQDALSLMMGYQIMPDLRACYSYDITTSPLAAYSSGSHEVFFNYCFNIEVKPRINGSYRNPIFL